MGEDAGSTRYIPERTLFDIDMKSVDVFSVDLNCNLNI